MNMTTLHIKANEKASQQNKNQAKKAHTSECKVKKLHSSTLDMSNKETLTDKTLHKFIEWPKTLLHSDSSFLLYLPFTQISKKLDTFSLKKETRH